MLPESSVTRRTHLIPEVWRYVTARRACYMSKKGKIREYGHPTFTCGVNQRQLLI